MYHNSNRMFHQYQFPSTTSSHDLYDVEVVTCPDTGALEYVHRRQFDIALPASFLLQMYRDIIGYLLVQENYTPVLSESNGPTTMHSTPLHVPDHIERLHVVTATFQDHPSRHVFVAQQVHRDPQYTSYLHNQRNRSLWYEVLALTPTSSRLRCLFMYSQLFDGCGDPVAFPDEAKCWGFYPSMDQSDGLQRMRFRDQKRAAAARHLSVAQARVLAYVHGRHHAASTK
ncbi:hypothetical protein H257_15661 [Aphanomyces astaci]|uniref:Uncharacterized protein n=1 Tax=Aphanomyces astaci TaxID=112090 RepID=W4FNS0_APHAT|nr:hypothetical protein H257_15661 [Aphanomyces astaci]ETV68338.1 hypothetical protein H257_15661 [Aphanomyces astaci]|eukprot:XP_009842133.1 hypothetical protein H257_15661 [Aphanomyces astaci]